VIEVVRSWLLSLEPWGTEVILWAQSWSTPFLDRLFGFITFLGEQELALGLLLLTHWCFNKRTGRRLAYAMSLSVYSNSFIKHTFMTLRPSDARIRVMRPVYPPSPNFPSGHAQNGLVTWGFVASRVRRVLVWALTALLVLLIGFSRIYLGVHDPAAVVGGWILGIILLGLFLWAVPYVERWLGQRTLWCKLVLAVVLPVAGLLLHRPDVRGLYPAPDAAAITGILLGISLGFLLEPRRIAFRVEGYWWQKLLRLVVGLTAVAIFWQGPTLLLPDDLVHSVAMAMRFVQHALIGFAATFLAPWLFVRLRLAERGPVQVPITDP
jgi:membrane-associated phospholipid phosphatase